MSAALSQSRPPMAVLARTQVARARYGTLCTLDRDDGTPYGSFVELLPRDDGSIVLLLSSLAEHTRNAAADPRVSIVVGDAYNSPYPQMSARVTLLGTLARLESTDALRSEYLAIHPRAAAWIRFNDFAFFELTPNRLRFIAGFGRMNWPSADDYLQAHPDMMASSADGVISHMNDDHRHNLVDMVRAFAQQSAATDAIMIGLDHLGFDVVAITDGHPHEVRIPFDEPLRHPREVRKAMVVLAQRAKGVEEG